MSAPHLAEQRALTSQYQEHRARLATLDAVIVIAHRILVLEQGELVEQGTHADLVKRSEGRYARLHALQMGAV